MKLNFNVSPQSTPQNPQPLVASTPTNNSQRTTLTQFQQPTQKLQSESKEEVKEKNSGIFQNLIVRNGDEKLNPLTNTPYSEQYYELLEQRKLLPVWMELHQLHTNENKAEGLESIEKRSFLQLITENQVLIISGETGSGKTTQVDLNCKIHFSELRF